MSEPALAAQLLLLVGGVVVLSIFLRAASERIGVPALVAFLGLGLLLRALADLSGWLPALAGDVLSFLGTLGVALLLFRVGLESRLGTLLGQLRAASPIWLGSVAVSGLFGYAAARLLGVDELPSLAVGVALTATSVAVPAAVWTASGRIESEEGQRFVDVAELDDISGVVLMALLLGVLPALVGGGPLSLAELGAEVGWVMLTLAGFVGVCALLYRWGEPHVGSLFARLEPQPQPLIGIVGIGLIIAASAALLGFSVAVGAFFAGVVFSRDPQHVNERTAFRGLYELFTPFFFIAVGFSLAPGQLWAGLGLGLALGLAAIAGKFVGTLLPALLGAALPSAVVLAVSMVPRAEITLVIGEQVRRTAPSAMPAEVQSALVVVVALTSTLGAIVLGRLLRQERADDSGRPT